MDRRAGFGADLGEDADGAEAELLPGGEGGRLQVVVDGGLLGLVFQAVGAPFVEFALGRGGGGGVGGGGGR